MRSPEAPSLRATRLRWLEAGALLAAALFALAFHLWLPPRLPTESDHQAAGKFLEQNVAEGDAILLFPWWTERARLYAPSRAPVIGYLGSDRDELTAYPRIWVLSQPSLPYADDGDFEEAFLPQRTPVGELHDFGPLRLQLYENGRHRPVVWRASEALAQAQVYLEESNGERRPCGGQNGRFRCAGGPHLYVAAEWHEVLYEPRHCMYLHAPGGDTKLVVELPDAPAADYLLEAGIIWEHASKTGTHRTATQVEASLGDVKLTAPIPVGVEGFQRARATSQGGPVRIAVSSREPDSRQVCLELTAFGEKR